MTPGAESLPFFFSRVNLAGDKLFTRGNLCKPEPIVVNGVITLLKGESFTFVCLVGDFLRIRRW